MEAVGIELGSKGEGSIDLSATEFLAYKSEMQEAMNAYKKFESENPEASSESNR